MFQRNEREWAEEKVFAEDSSYTLSDFLNAGEGIPMEEKVSAYLQYAEKEWESLPDCRQGPLLHIERRPAERVRSS